MFFSFQNALLLFPKSSLSRCLREKDWWKTDAPFLPSKSSLPPSDSLLSLSLSLSLARVFSLNTSCFFFLFLLPFVLLLFGAKQEILSTFRFFKQKNVFKYENRKKGKKAGGKRRETRGDKKKARWCRRRRRTTRTRASRSSPASSLKVGPCSRRRALGRSAQSH